MVLPCVAAGHDDPVHPLVKLALAWLVTTGLAVTLGVVAVGVVTDSVTQDRPDRLSAIGVRNALTAVESPGGATTTATAGPGRPAATAPSGPAATGPRVTTSPPTSPGPTSPATTPTTTTATTTPGATFPPPEDRTYQLVGGTVGVRFENGGAWLLWATPKPGFSVETSGGGSDQVDVRFRGEDHESRLEAFWDNGPQADVEERER